MAKSKQLTLVPSQQTQGFKNALAVVQQTTGNRKRRKLKAKLRRAYTKRNKAYWSTSKTVAYPAPVQDAQREYKTKLLGSLAICLMAISHKLLEE